MGLLEDKVVFITGGARGQGRAHAVASAQQGADVALLDSVAPIPTVGYPLSTEEDLALTAKEVEATGRRALTFVGDVRSQVTLDKAVAETISTFGKIDAMVANAGIWSRARFWEMTDEQWDQMISINLSGVWKTAKAVAPHMIERNSGSIVMISSMDGEEAGDDYVHYVAAKHGVIGLTKACAAELAPYGVRCNAIMPGAIDTVLLDNQPAYDMLSGHPGGTRDDLVKGVHHYNPFRKTSLIDPMHIANAAVFLHSDMAAMITGIRMPVDAGHMLVKGYVHDPVL
ncbi:mycofactocin-coupled SDR family oxidoreductase [Mycolicibacterium setense]|jgi:SDR family mycofactocin-dependent oxidoreductase